MRHSCHCPPHACRPPQPEGVLLPKILCNEKRVIPRLCTTLQVNGLPDCRAVRIVRIEPSCIPPTWSPGTPDGCGRSTVNISIPVDVTVCDDCGRQHTGNALVETNVVSACASRPGWQQRLLIVPCIQLLCSEPGCGSCFDVQLHLTLDIYLLCLQPHMMHPPAPACPDLPLYPQPTHMSQSIPCR